MPAEAGSLFNLKDDPGETTDVSETYPEKVQQLTRMMTTFMAELEANSRPIGNVPGTHVSGGKTNKNSRK